MKWRFTRVLAKSWRLYVCLLCMAGAAALSGHVWWGVVRFYDGVWRWFVVAGTSAMFLCALFMFGSMAHAVWVDTKFLSGKGINE